MSSKLETENSKLSLALLFLRLGTTAFGGPAAHIAMMHSEVVTRRQWLTETEFLDRLAASNLIPGPSSTELAIHIGYRRAGAIGLLLAGFCFILPAAILCTLIAALYVRFGQLPISQNILYGIKPVVIAIIAQALYKLGKSVLKSPLLAALAVTATVINFFLGHELLVLFGSGLLIVLARTKTLRHTPTLALAPVLPNLTNSTNLTNGTATSVATTAATAAATTAALSSPALLAIFLVFLKIGSVLFGSGYVLLAFLQADLVDRYHWLKQPQLLDAVAVGQFTPGPVFTTATFIGYLLSGPLAALAATVGIFLPAFILVALTAPLMDRLRNSPITAAFLDGLNAASLALMAVVTIHLAIGTLTRTNAAGQVGIDWPAAALAGMALALLLWKKNLNSAWLVLGGGLVGVCLKA